MGTTRAIGGDETSSQGDSAALEIAFSFVDSAARDGDETARELLLPKKATSLSSGYDLVAAVLEPVTLRPRERVLVPTGIAIALPSGFEGQVRPRSGLAFRHGITVLNAPGTIDADYRGEIGIVLIHLGEEPFTIERGMRVAQLVIAPTCAATLIESTLRETERGSGGFGSTGLHAAATKESTSSPDVEAG